MTCKIVQVVTFALVASSAFAITCYKCDSSDNKSCSYGISSFLYDTVDCDQEFGGGSSLTNWLPKQCVKLVAKGKDGTDYVARGCLPQVGSSACKEIVKNLHIFSKIENNIEDIDCLTCDGDKCNSAPKFTGYALLGVILAAFLFML